MLLDGIPMFQYPIHLMLMSVGDWVNNRKIWKEILALNEQSMVHNALQQISSVSCLRFQYVPQQPNTNHLYYTKFSTAGL